jgi:hypothetical protein
LEQTLINTIKDRFHWENGYQPNEPEVRSWEKSLAALSEDLAAADLSNVEVLIEHRLPLTSRRIDALLVGQHPTTKRPSLVVVELKQWTDVQFWENSTELVIGEGFHGQPRAHPQIQVDGYVDYLSGFIKYIETQNAHVKGVAYLHNASDLHTIQGLDSPSKMFSGSQRGELRDFLKSNLSNEVESARIADSFLQSDIAPSKHLMKVVAEELKSRNQFVLLDEQQEAVSLVRHAVESSYRGNSKRIVLVTGGPGSGKSVIALSVLADLASTGRKVLHATGSRSFTLTLRELAGKTATAARAIFKYFNNFMDAVPNSIDVLIMDEAHRLRDTSETRYTAAALRTGRKQIDEVVSVARVPVFLLDEKQVVRPGEMGSVEQILEYANSINVEVLQIDLKDQFRCGGSEKYINWVNSLLGLTEIAAFKWEDEPGFRVEVVDSVEQMESDLLKKLNGGYGARMTAGFCWPWSDPVKGELVSDVKVGTWSRPWNTKGDRAVGAAPPSALWATDIGGFGQVGCIYTAQGFEYDWNGVIIGPDLVWRTDKWVVVRKENKDPSFKSTTQVSDGQMDELVRNVYKVLLTRGMQGTLIYTADEETKNYLASLIQ